MLAFNWSLKGYIHGILRKRSKAKCCCRVFCTSKKNYNQGLQEGVHRSVARKLSIGGLYVWAGGLNVRAWEAWHSNLTKNPLIFRVSYFNLWGLELCLGGLSPLKPPRGDGTGGTWGTLYPGPVGTRTWESESAHSNFFCNQAQKWWSLFSSSSTGSYNQGRIKWTRGPGQSRDHEAP